MVVAVAVVEVALRAGFSLDASPALASERTDGPFFVFLSRKRSDEARVGYYVPVPSYMERAHFRQEQGFVLEGLKDKR